MRESLQLRPKQQESIEALRDGRRAGHVRQLLVGPTGFGKTSCAVHVLQEACRKGSRSAFIVDRVSLVDQASATLDRYGVDHGVIQAGHWRRRSSALVQVCSVQTLEKRGIPGDWNLIIIDEAHCVRRQLAEHLKRHDNVATIGLTATPFTDGLGEIYSNVVNVTTTNAEIEAGYLVPLRVYAAKAVDMTGAKVIAGEWSEREIEQRGSAIVGDVVAEWVDKTHKLFGGPAKTIVFSATVPHGDELCRQFQAAGFNFQQVSYKDGNDQARRDLIEEFRRPNSSIHGLVSCEALTKGFDVPDVMVGVACRPYRKSFSSHIQQLGRVMRAAPGKEFGLWLDHCLLEGTPVLTERGLVPIEQVRLDDRLWDGAEWVTHGGPVYKGVRDVITYAGLTATADHLVKTPEGWRAFGAVASEQGAIVQTGVGGATVREREGYFAGCPVAWSAHATPGLRDLRVRYLPVRVRDRAGQFAEWAHQGLRRLQPASAYVPGLVAASSGGDEAAVHQSEQRWVHELRRAWNRISIRFSQAGVYLDSRQPRDRGTASGTRQGQQRRALRAGQPALVNGNREQHEPSQLMGRDGAATRIPVAIPGDPLCGRNDQAAYVRQDDGRTDRSEVRTPVPQAQGRVWDILNAGPRNRFTAADLLVHNCGNYLRFFEDQQLLFSDGVQALEDGELDKKTRQEPDEKQKSQLKCAACGFVLPGGVLACPACGAERRVRQSLLESLPGTMVEIDGGRRDPRKPGAAPAWMGDRESVWRQLVGMGLLRKKGDIDAAAKFARGHFKGLYEEWPQSPFDVNKATQPSEELRRKVMSRIIAYAKAQGPRRAA